jgi:hypothetical protein
VIIVIDLNEEHNILNKINGRELLLKVLGLNLINKIKLVFARSNLKE